MLLVGIVHEQIKTMSVVDVRIMVVSKRDTSFTIKVNPSSDLCFVCCWGWGNRIEYYVCEWVYYFLWGGWGTKRQ